MSKFGILKISLLAAAVAVGAGCKRQSDRAGEGADQAGEQAKKLGQEAQDMGEQAQDTAKQAGEKAQEAGEKAQDSAERATGEIGEGADSERQPVAGTEGMQILIVDQTGRRMPMTDQKQLQKVEEKLKDEGLTITTVDGKADAQTLTAIMEFQRKRGLPATGTLDQATVEALGIDWSELGGMPAGEQPSDMGTQPHGTP